MKKYSSLIVLIILIAVPLRHAQTYSSPKTPTRIIINLTESPSKSMAVTWRTLDEVTVPEVKIAEASAWTEFESIAGSIKVKSIKIVTDKKDHVFEHSAIMNGLKPNTLYAYMVGGDSVWSEWNQFRTANDTTAPFMFVFFGDPQNDLKQHCSRVFREAFKKAPSASFWMFSGDITSEPEDDQWDGFFYAGGFIFATIPSAIVLGNHDIAYLMQDGKIVRNEKGKKQRGNKVSDLWKEQFTLPENGLPGFEETSYTFDYQGARFIVINTNDEKNLSVQSPWIEKLLSGNQNKWTIISFHHPFYSAGRDRDDEDTKNAYLKLFDKYNVDLVLTGHDHAYSRSYKLKNNFKVPDNEKGTVYVVSVSGPKMYSVNSKYNNLMAKTGGNVQLFQTIAIKDNNLILEAYTATGELFDSFILKK
jgi:acid phosphatase type 7